MSTDPISQPQGSAGNRLTITKSLTELPILLSVAKSSRASDWQDIVARHVAMLSADFQTQMDDRIALREISLISLAAQKGSNDAKKRSLRATRWLSVAPPSISDAIENLDEARAAVRVLQPLRANWAIRYVQLELTRNKWPSMIGAYVAWGFKASVSLEGFLDVVNGTEVPSGASASGWMGIVLQATLKPMASARQPSGSGFMAEIERLALKASVSGGESPAADKGERQAAQRAIIAVVSRCSAVDPGVLLQGAAIAAVRSVAAMSKSPDAVATSEFEILCRRLIALAGLLLPAANRQLLSHLKNLWSAYRECIPRAEQVFKSAISENPALRSLEGTDHDEPEGDQQATPALESVLTELVANWDSYAEIHHGDPAVQQLSLRIEDLIQHLGIVRYGVAGEVVAFDPLRHHLPDATRTPPTRVIVRKPGIALQRRDGTSRVLVPAIVSVV